MKDNTLKQIIVWEVHAEQMSAGNLTLPSKVFRHFSSFINTRIRVYLSVAQLSILSPRPSLPKRQSHLK